MDNSAFTTREPLLVNKEPYSQGGGTCDAFRVKLYGKLHFLKQLKPQYANDVRYRLALQKEFETGYRLEHPHLVRYISLNAEGILMEYVDGDTLTRVLNDQPSYFHRRDRLHLFLRQLFEAVQYLHEHQILHLDLKPDNILLSHIDHDVKLVDLGCCLTDTFPDTPGRTPDYAAPEQLREQASVDERTDIYALGRILAAIHQKAPLPRFLQKLQQKCCQEDPEQRPASVAALVQELDRHERKQRRARRTLIAALALLITLTACTLLYNRLSTRFAQIQTPIHDTIFVETPVVGPAIHDTVFVDTKPSPEETRRAQYEREMQMAIDKAYQSTISTYQDSAFAKTWNTAANAFVNKMNTVCEQLAKKYPEYALPQIQGTVMAQCNFYLSIVADKMAKNREKREEMDKKSEMEEMVEE